MFALIVLFLFLNLLSFLVSSFGLFFYLFWDRRKKSERFFSISLAVSLSLFHLALFLKVLLFYLTDPMVNTTRTFLAIDLFTSIFTKAFTATAALCYVGIVLPIWNAMVNIQMASPSSSPNLYPSNELIRKSTIFIGIIVLLATFGTMIAVPAYQIGIHLTFYPHSLALLYSAIVVLYMNFTLVKALKTASNKSTRLGIFRLLLINTSVFSYSPMYICLKSLPYLMTVPKDLSSEEYDKVRGSRIDLDLELNLLNYTASVIGPFALSLLLSGPSTRQVILEKLFKQPATKKNSQTKEEASIATAANSSTAENSTQKSTKTSTE